MSKEEFQGAQGPLGYLLRQAQHTFRIAIDRALAEYNVTHPQFAILNLLQHAPMSHSADIARISMFSPQAVNVIIRALEKRKLIERMPHETHGRILVTRLTPLGEKCWAQCRRKVDALEKTVCQPLSLDTEKAIREWLVYVKTTLQ